MGRIPEEIIEEVLTRTDILQLVGQYVSLKRAGTNHKGLCPFHEEKTPSFYVHPGKGIYKCFGCGAGGNAFRFLMELEGWSFPEAVRHLAKQTGVEIPEESEEEAEAARQRQQARDLYHRVMKLARSFYEQNLWDEVVGERARGYLESRGIDEETARAFGVGYAPPGWQNLLDYLGENRVNGALAERAGLAIPRRGSTGHYDRFRDRIIFPVIDIWGHTLAFGGRVLPGDDGPKYINSSETRFYTKGRHLFGLHAAKQPIQKAEWALLVEGNFDVIALHAAGMRVAVAPMGTAFTERQARLLKRYASRVVIAFDGDDAGEAATARCLEAIEAAGLEGLVIRFEPGDDPDTFVRREGVAALEALVERAEPLIGWCIERVLPPAGEQRPIEDRIKLLEEAAGIMEKVREPIVWKHYAEELSRRLDIEARLFKRYLKRPEQARRELRERAEAAPEQAVTLVREEFTLLVLLLKHPEWLEDFLGEQLDNLLRSAELAEFLHVAERIRRARGEQFNPGILLEHVPTKGFEPIVADALINSRNDTVFDGMATDEELEKLEENAVRLYQDTLHTLKIDWASRSREAVSQHIEELNTDYMANREELKELMQQKHMLDEFIKTEKAARQSSA